jgi:hypothetical protein
MTVMTVTALLTVTATGMTVMTVTVTVMTTKVAVIPVCITVAASNGWHPAAAAAAAGQSCLPAGGVGQKSSWHNVQTSEQWKRNGILHLGHANLRLACSHASINPPHTEHLPSSALNSVLARDQALHLALANGSFALANKYLGI